MIKKSIKKDVIKQKIKQKKLCMLFSMSCPIIKTNLAIEVFGVTNKRCKQHKGLAKPAVIMMKSH